MIAKSIENTIFNGRYFSSFCFLLVHILSQYQCIVQILIDCINSTKNTQYNLEAREREFCFGLTIYLFCT